MKLTDLQITSYRSVADSTKFKIGDVTCLVGKNESGKTNILRCLERLNPLDAKLKAAYDEDMDWPRTSDDAPKAEERVLRTTWHLDGAELKAIEAELGTGCFKSPIIETVSRFGGNQIWTLHLDDDVMRAYLMNKYGVPPEEQAKVASVPLEELGETIAKNHSTIAHLKSVADHLAKYRESQPYLKAIDILKATLPKMLYFASYDRLGGRISIDDLIGRRNSAPANLPKEHQLFLMFLDYAGVKPEELQNPKTAEGHIARLERAQNRITNKIFKYWSQNAELEVRFEALPGRSQDPAPFNSGTVFHTRIYNRLHRMTVPFDERSAGFTWFFSFLVQFTQLREKHKDLIILLDEPGGSLHGKAQQDLLRFIDEELMPYHQVIYTTHSPFMVPAANLERVRVVEDVVFQDKNGNKESKGTKVSSDFLSVGNDTRFPLQGALGYEITQSLFIGPHSLLVEGPSDILFLQSASRALVAQGRSGIDKRWTMCPAGGVNKVHAFVSLFSGNALKAAVLVDLAIGPNGNKREVTQLRSSKILEAARIFTAADFTGLPESDTEDMLGDAAYICLVDAAFDLKGRLTAKELAKIAEKSPRVVKRVEAWFREQAGIPEFDHYRPAEYLILNPQFIAEHKSAFTKSLEHFEAFFKKVNALL